MRAICRKLDPYAEDAAVLAAAGGDQALEQGDLCPVGPPSSKGVQLNTDAIFDVQVKRLHEYKRQLLNVLHIIALYQQLQDDPDMDFPPTDLPLRRQGRARLRRGQAHHPPHQLSGRSDRTATPSARDKLQVVFLENYRVSLAEMLMPASEVSQQISTAGKEASGTGNMKFMMNGALTIGTLDGANVEMHEVLGDENMFLFGLTADEVSQHEPGLRPVSAVYT